MIKASVYMITKNEERFVGDTLELLRDFDEVIVVDSGSTDKTPEIAKSFPNVKFFHHDWPGFARQKQWALEQCSNEWVINLDADEHVQPELLKEIQRVVEENKTDGLFFAMSDVFMGRPCRLWKIAGRLRCFRKSCGAYDLTNEVHEGIIFTGKSTEKTHAAMLHYGIPDVATAIPKQNHYSTLKAQEKFKKGKRTTPLKMLTIFPYTFFVQYFLKANYRDGWAGFIRTMMASNYAFMKEAKLMDEWRKAKEAK